MEFNNLRTPPFGTLKPSIALETIGNLTGEKINLGENPYAFSALGMEAKRLSTQYGVDITMTKFGIGQINLQVQSLIDKLISDKRFTLEEFAVAFEEESKNHPKGKEK